MKYILKSKAKLFGSLSKIETYGTCKSGGYRSLFSILFIFSDIVKCTITNVNVQILQQI